MSEETIPFDSVPEFTAVMGRPADLSGWLSTHLHIQVHSRDLWVRLEGAPEKVETGAAIIACLRDALRLGMELRRNTVEYICEGFLKGQGEAMRSLARLRIDLGPRRRPVLPRTLGQRRYVQAIMDHEVTFGAGPAGSGKTYLAMAMAAKALLDHKVRRIILTRPAVEAGEALGFLPGDLQQKIQPYLRPLYDALHDMMDADLITQYMEKGIIEVAPLAFMRGRTLNEAFIILDEAQNTTPAQMLMFLTRIGFDSRCVVTGDPTQIDLPGHKPSGLIEALRALRPVHDISIIQLGDQDVVRHPLVRKIVDAYRRHRSDDVHPDQQPIGDGDETDTVASEPDISTEAASESPNMEEAR